jgi:predicted SPOUT superfamily RNA methylase MTH1
MFLDFPKSCKLRLFLPDSLLENENTLMLKTLKIGSLARIFCIFRINEIFFYNNSGTFKDKKTIEDVLNHLSVAPYLRKYFPKSPLLKFSGILNPLQAPNHIGVIQGEVIYKEGIIKKTTVTSNSAKYEVDIGLKKSEIINIDTKCGNNLSEGEIVIVKINSNGSKIFKLKGIDKFWKYRFSFLLEPLSSFIKKSNKNDTFIIGTSRYGEKINDKQNIIQIKNALDVGKTVELLFGPLKGSFMKYLLKDLHVSDKVDNWINFVPNQGTKTIKLEEAILSTLSILNTL